MAINNYFTADGSYGAAIDGIIVDTERWTDRDWQDIEACDDWSRASLASYITECRGGRIAEMVPGPWVTLTREQVEGVIDLDDEEALQDAH
jgi:hypothetical protein